MNWIQNDNQNVDGVDQHPKAWQSLYLFIGDILFHNVTQFWCCFMSDDRARLHVEASVFRFLLHLCFLEILYRRCVLPYNNKNMDSRSTSIAQIFFRLFLSISQVYLNVILKYISEKYIKPISEKYMKSRLKVYFPILV